VHVLIINRYFPPEVEPSASKMHEIAREWVRSGLEVTVIAGIPSYPSGVVDRRYRRCLWRVERTDGIQVVRTYAAPSRPGEILRRILSHLSFMISGTVAALFMKRCDVVLASSPPLEVALTGLLVARLKRRPFIFEVRDLWPDDAISLGLIQNRLIIGFTRLAERFCYRKADRVVVVSPGFVDHVASTGVEKKRIEVIVNGTDTVLFRPRGTKDPLLRDLFAEGSTIVLYAGTFGLQHNLITVMRTAALLKGENGLSFVLIGDGCDRAELQKAKAGWDLENVVLLPVQPRRKIASLIASADICLVHTARYDINLRNLPAKVFDYMACARPIVIAGRGEARALVEGACAGTSAEPDDPESLRGALLSLAGDPGLRALLGENGRRFAIAHCSRQVVATHYVGLLAETVAGWNGAGTAGRGRLN
jgi:colanic acid biosynthesis glycosyl transferase WcaI